MNRLASKAPSLNLSGDFANCEEALGALLGALADEAGGTGALTTAMESEAAALEAGGTAELQVDVSLGETSGLVTLTTGKSVVPIPVDNEDGDWRLSNPGVILFGVGKNAG